MPGVQCIETGKGKYVSFMSLRLKIHLTFLGVVLSIASLGSLGLNYLSQTRRSEADLRQLNSQRILLNRVWSDLDSVLTVGDRLGATVGTVGRGSFDSDVHDVLRSLDDLRNSGLPSETRDRVLALRAEVRGFWNSLAGRADGDGSPEDLRGMPSYDRQLSVGIRKHQQALSRLFDEEFVQANLATSDRLRRAHVWLFLAIVVGVGLSVGFGYLLHRLLLEPLEELKSAATQIRLGNRRVSFGPPRHDEFAQVQAAFIDMGADLEKQFEAEKILREDLDATNLRLEREKADFERLVEVGRIVASALEGREVLRLLTTRAAEMIPCRRCSVVQLEPGETGRARILSSELHERGGPVSIDLDKYPEIQAVALVRQPVQIDDTASDTRFEQQRSALESAGVRSILAVPMLRQGDLMGVLSFVRGMETTDEFTTWERRVAETIASVGAVCIENARLFATVREKRDEVDQLNRSLRSSLDDLHEARDRLIETERLAAVGEMAASVAHSLRNPLASIRALAQATEGEASAQAATQTVRLVDRMERHLVQILDFSRLGRENRVEVDACALVTDVADQLRIEAESGHKSIHVDSDAAETPFTVVANPERLERAILAVMENAVEAGPEGSTIAVSAGRDGDAVCIEIRDDGPGIDADTLSRVTEPFFTTKSHGTGLGTTIARKVVESLQGQMEILSREGDGTRVRIRIPGTGT